MNTIDLKCRTIGKETKLGNSSLEGHLRRIMDTNGIGGSSEKDISIQSIFQTLDSLGLVIVQPRVN